MKSGDIFIYGDIYNNQSDEASAWGEVSLTTVKDAVNALPADTTDLVVHIHSRGGDVFEGFAIHDFLVSTGKNITTKIEGLCASIATVVALAGSKRIMTENSTFMIHNPSGFAMGTADDIEEQVEFIRTLENKIIDFYVLKTGKAKEDIDSWMKEEKFMTSDEALELNFITEIVKDISVAALYIVPKQTKTFEMSKDVKDLLSSVKASLDKVAKVFGKVEDEPIVNNLILNTSDGKQIEIVTKETEANVGDKALVDGKTANDGEFSLMDGTKIEVSGGIVSSITDPEGNEDTAVAELKAENEALKAELSEIKSIQANMAKTLSLIADNIESTYKPATKVQNFNTKKSEEDVSKMSPAQKALYEAKLKKEENASSTK